MASWNAKLVVAYFCTAFLTLCFAGNLNRDFDMTWGEGRAKISKDGKVANLSLDKASGCGIQSKKEYLFGKMDLQMKLVPGNSAGIVTTFYLSSQGTTHDEIDFEFLGNLSGDPYILHTNVYTQGKGDREQQFYLWFDPTADFHTYSILWNPQAIIFYVDGTPIRAFKNLKTRGIAFPETQAMRVYASIWDAEEWATRGGQVKTDWSQAPFTASLRNFKSDACERKTGRSSCNKAWLWQQLDSDAEGRMRWVQQNYMVYDYCADINRFPQGLPPECTLNATTSPPPPPHLIT